MRRISTPLTTIALALCAPVVMAQAIPVANMPAEKQRELQAAGLTEWTPGSGKNGKAAVISELAPGSKAEAPQGVGGTGTIQYDDGNFTALATVFGQIYGNQFSQGLGGAALGASTLNSFSFYFLEDSLSDTGLFLQPGVAGGPGVINALASVNVSGLLNSGADFSNPQLNVRPASDLGIGAVQFTDTLFLGGWSLNTASAFPVDNETIGLSTNGPRQQGYTANSGGAGASVLYTSQPFNAMLRANITSSNAVPVELMNHQHSCW